MQSDPNENLPAEAAEGENLPAEAFGEVDFGGEAVDAQPRIFIDQGKGEVSQGSPGRWNLGGELYERIHVILLAFRYFRTLFRDKYEDNPDSPQICRSWDGYTAFGRANEVEYKERRCAVEGPRGGMKSVCPLAVDFKCRPQMRFFVLAKAPIEDAMWLPAWYDVHGLAVAPTKKQYQRVLERAAMNRKLRRHFLASTAEATKPNPKRDGYAPYWKLPVWEVSDEEKPHVHELARYGKEVFLADRELAEQTARELDIPEDEKESGPKPLIQHNVKDDEIPF